MSDEEPKKHGLLQTIFADSDTTVKLMTMMLVVVSGGTNLFATKSLSEREKANVKHALSQIYDLQIKLDRMEQRQRGMEQTLNDLNHRVK
jgi:hypothetical protein